MATATQSVHVHTQGATCPRCGYQFKARESLVLLMVNHPRIEMVESDATRTWWRSCPNEFLLGAVMGVSDLASVTFCDKGTVSYYLKHLIGAGIVEPVSMTRRSRYARYRVIIKPD
jgi:hypothetical protein